MLYKVLILLTCDVRDEKGKKDHDNGGKYNIVYVRVAIQHQCYYL